MNDARWYTVQTKPRAEEQARAALASKGLDILADGKSSAR